MRTLSFAKSVPKGLRLSECKRGIGSKNLPICYIPEKDPVQEALEKNKKTNYFKLMLPHTGSELKVAQWASGTPEQFILHVRSAIHACKQMEHDIKFFKAKEAVANAILELEIKKDDYVQVCSSEKASESLKAAKLAYKKRHRLLMLQSSPSLQKERRPLNSMEIYYLMRPGSLVKRSSRPKQLNICGKTSMKSLMMKLLPKLGTPLWSASHST